MTALITFYSYKFAGVMSVCVCLSGHRFGTDNASYTASRTKWGEEEIRDQILCISLQTCNPLPTYLEVN